MLIRWHRAEGHASYDGITARGTDAWANLCRVLTNLGYRDGPANVDDERGVPCWHIRSIHRCARMYRPTPAEAAAQAERREAKRKAA